MIKNVLAFLLPLFIVLTLSSCNVSPKAPTELIKRPKLSVENNLAKEKIQRELPKDADLIRPLSPGKLNSVGYFDVDGDEKNEAYAFYRLEKEHVIGVMILKHNQDEWELISRTQISGNDISFADFVDFNSDGKKDLLFGSDTSEGIYGVVNVYLWVDSSYREIWSGEFTHLVIDDMNGNKNKEILCIKHDRDSFSSISAYGYTSEGFQLIDELEMDLYIKGYYNTFSGNLLPNQRALFLDFNLGSKAGSNVVILKDGKLIPLLPVFNPEESEVSQKNDDIKSKDINGDKIVEIARNYELAYSVKEEASKKGIYEWKQYDPDSDEKFKTVAMSFIDRKSFYEFIFPDKWLKSAMEGKIALVLSRDKDERNYVSYYYLTENLDSYHLLTLEYFTDEEMKKFVKSEKGKLYTTIDLHSRGDSSLVAYYNKKLAPYNEKDKEEFKDLVLSKKEIISHIVYLK